MTTLVILAAGRGSRLGRVGDSLHKALVPINSKAVISHIIDQYSTDTRIIVATGHRASQVEEYLTLAHPNRHIICEYVHDWMSGGPGASLLAMRNLVGDDEMYFTSCDTLVNEIPPPGPRSFIAVAPLPAEIPGVRWCRIEKSEDGRVAAIFDKRPGGNATVAYVGMGYIAKDDVDTFMTGITNGTRREGELQVTGGWEALGPVLTWPVSWTDVGDEASYQAAVHKYTGYDWTKLDEATYLLPESQRVIKFWANGGTRLARYLRGNLLGSAVPNIRGETHEMLAYEYVPGVTAYTALEVNEECVTERILDWAETMIWPYMPIRSRELWGLKKSAALAFYRDKTIARVDMLKDADLRTEAMNALEDVDWSALAEGCSPAMIHGDFNFGNIIVAPHGFVGIDWREDFAGYISWGDQRYDFGKLLAGCIIHWDRARRGNFHYWANGRVQYGIIKQWMIRKGYSNAFIAECELIGALSLLNSAPLHASPLDRIAAHEGIRWLRRCV